MMTRSAFSLTSLHALLLVGCTSILGFDDHGKVVSEEDWEYFEENGELPESTDSRAGDGDGDTSTDRGDGDMSIDPAEGGGNSGGGTSDGGSSEGGTSSGGSGEGGTTLRTGGSSSTGGSDPIGMGGSTDAGKTESDAQNQSGQLDFTQGGQMEFDFSNAYLQTDTLNGYAFVYAEGGTQNPVDFSDRAQPPYCMFGTVEPHPDYQNFAMLGVNLNQPVGDETGELAGTITPVSPQGGLVLEIANPGGSVVRLQIQTSSEPTATRWCYELAEGSQIVEWSQFNTTCWDPAGGEPYDGVTPISQAALIVPGDNTATIEYDVCLFGITEPPLAFN